MGLSRTPGPYDFPACFFQKFWDVTMEKVVPPSLEIHNRRKSVSAFNQTSIVFILKKKNPLEASDFCLLAYVIWSIRLLQTEEKTPHSVVKERQQRVDCYQT